MKVNKNKVSLSREASELLYVCTISNPVISKRISRDMNYLLEMKLLDTISGKDVKYPVKHFKENIHLSRNKIIQICISEKNKTLIEEALKKDPYVLYKFRKHFNSLLLFRLFKLKEKVNTIPLGDAIISKPIKCL